MKHIVLLILIPLLLLGCSPAIPLSRTIDPGVSDLRVGERFTVRLESNPSTGYLWDITEAFATENVQLVSNVVEQKATKNVVGAPVDQVWTFMALRSGKTQVSFGYHRPWENIKPVQKKRYVLNIT